jgi:2-methylcitrate dehydratase PrpD
MGGRTVNATTSNTRLLSDFASSLRYLDIPADVVAKAKAVILDCLGCAVGGGDTMPAQAVLRAFRSVEAPGECTIIGQRGGVNALQASYVNAFLVDILDYEETTNVSHPSAAVVPAALSAAEMFCCSGRDLLTAVVAGIEAACRVAGACIPSPERLSRVATLFYAETIGAAAACGRIMNLSSGEFENLFGIAAAHTPLPLWVSRWAKPRHWTKNNWGQQASSGLLSSLLAREGFCGPWGVFDSDIGFWRMVGSDRFDPGILTEGLGDRFQLSAVGFKWYPCCMWLHPALHAAHQILGEAGIDPGDIESVTVRTSGHVVRNFADYDPENIVDAEFSMPYTMAAVLVGIPPGPQWFSPAIMNDPGIRDMMDRVALEVDSHADDQFNKQEAWVATVEIKTRCGKEYARQYVHSRKQSSSVDWGRIEAKFRGLATNRLGPSACDSIVEAVQALEGMESVRHLTGMLVPNGGD